MATRLHELKIWPAFYDAVANGEKPFEVRKNDRDFKRGDTLLLREYNHVDDALTGRAMVRKISYVMLGGCFGVEEGYCVMGLSREVPNGH